MDIYGSVRLIVVVFVINPPGSGREKKNWELLCVKSTWKHFGHAGCIIYDFGFGRKCFGRHGCDNISALELGSARPGYGLVCIGSAQLGQNLGPAQMGSDRLGSARPGPARPGPARLGLARLASARLRWARQLAVGKKLWGPAWHRAPSTVPVHKMQPWP